MVRKKSIRSAHLISSSGMYGAERWVLALLNYFDKKNTLLICSNWDNDAILGEAASLGIATDRIITKGNFSLVQYIRNLKAILDKYSIDILHTHGYKTDLLGLAVAKWAGIKIVSTPHGWERDCGLKLHIYQFLDQLALAFFHKVAPLSEELGRSLKFVKSGNVEVIQNFVDLNSLPAIQKGNVNKLIYIGQLIHRKCVRDLLTAFSKVTDHNIHLDIVGDGPQREKLEAYSRSKGLDSRVHFHGYRRDRLDLLNQACIYILPSSMEGIPRAMMEAMAMEKMVIGTDIPGIRDLITHGETGLLVPLNQPAKLAEAIQYALQNDNARQKMQRNARLLIEKDFSAANAAERFSELYNGLLFKLD